MQQRPQQEQVEDVISLFAPDLVILDSLRSFNPAMEGANATAGAQITRMRAIAAGRGTAFLLATSFEQAPPAAKTKRFEAGGVMESGCSARPASAR